MAGVMRIGIASDHAGYGLKVQIGEWLRAKGYEVVDYGTNSPASVDYPDYAHALATGLESGNVEFGVAMCGSGNGISMSLNRHRGIRAALCWRSELATLARAHNDANVLSLPARYISLAEALPVVEAFLSTAFEGGRHQRRVEKIEYPPLPSRS